MLKLIIASYFLLGLYTSSYSQHEWFRDHLSLSQFGKVKSIKETESRINTEFGKIKNKSLMNSRYANFSEDGLDLDDKFYLFDGSPQFHNSYRVVDKTLIVVYGYDKMGYKYRDGFYRFIYDNNGNEIEHENLNSNSQLLERFTYKYDSRGNIIETVRYDPDPRVKEYNWRETSKFNAGGDEKETYEYDANGKLSSKSFTKYDDKGNEIESTVYNSDGSFDLKIAYSYEYDNHGNWLRKIQYNGNGIQVIEFKREIEYYD